MSLQDTQSDRQVEKALAPDPAIRVGHVHLKVSDLQRSIAFYKDVLGLTVMQQMGNQAAFLSFGGYHHHVALNTWQSKGGAPAPQSAPGLFHLALLYPDRRSLAVAVHRVLEMGVSLEGASDHGVSEAVYFNDPDGNGIELYVDRPRENWPQDGDGNLHMVTLPLNLQDLLAS